MHLKHPFSFGALLALALFASGCHARSSGSRSASAAFRPSNVYRAGQRLPPQVRRVAVLPLSVEPGDWQAEEGRRELEPVFQAELGKIKAFELAVVPPDQLRHWTGKATWNAEEQLPADFFERLQEALGCDAALFCHLRPFQTFR